MRPNKRVWIVCDSSDLERRAIDRLCDVLGDEGLLIEHSAPTLLTRADRIRLMRQLHLHRHLGRRVLLVRRLDRLGAREQSRLCQWLSSGRPGADYIVATGRWPRTAADKRRLKWRVGTRFKPVVQVEFDADACEPRMRTSAPT